MNEHSGYYVRLDVHKESVAIAIADGHQRSEPRLIGTTGYSVHEVCKALASLGSEPAEISIAYEAVPYGYGTQRELSQKGIHLRCCCAVTHSEVTSLNRNSCPV
jgi:transposase